MSPPDSVHPAPRAAAEHPTRFRLFTFILLYRRGLIRNFHRARTFGSVSFGFGRPCLRALLVDCDDRPVFVKNNPVLLSHPLTAYNQLGYCGRYL